MSRTAITQNRGFKGIFEFSESFVKLDFISKSFTDYFSAFSRFWFKINGFIIFLEENSGVHIRGSECDQKILSKKESTGFVYSPNYPFPYIPKVVCR